MKIYGYTKKNANDLAEMSEVSFQGSSSQLVSIANFLLKYAEIMQKESHDFEHVHIKDECKDWDNSFPDIIVNKQ